MRAFFVSLFVAATVFVTPPSTAQDFDAGWAALRAGDYETALSHLEPLALAGDDHAMVGMGYLYLNGFAVAENYTIAFRIFRDAADLGNTRSTRPGRCVPPSPDGGMPRARHQSAVERWGSVSIRATFSPRIAAYTARCTARVVLPAPPL